MAREFCYQYGFIENDREKKTRNNRVGIKFFYRLYEKNSKKFEKIG